MKIKQLVWEKHVMGGVYADTPFSVTYWLNGSEESVLNIRLEDSSGEDYRIDFIYFRGTLKDAKAAAQADFEKRVMACFETTDKSNFWG